jgi:hypothetical protein
MEIWRDKKTTAQMNALKFRTHIGSDINFLSFLKKRVDDTNMAIPRSSMDATCTSLKRFRVNNAQIIHYMFISEIIETNQLHYFSVTLFGMCR